jgi:hypothetical protein
MDFTQWAICIGQVLGQFSSLLPFLFAMRICDSIILGIL